VGVGDREIDGLRVACGVPVLCSSLAGTPRPHRTNLLLVCQLLCQRSPPPQFGLRGLAHFNALPQIFCWLLADDAPVPGRGGRIAAAANAMADDAPAPGAPAQGHDDDSARPLSLPPLNLLASLRVRQDEDHGEVAARPSLPPQRQVTKHIMQTWTLHEQMLRNPPSDRMRDVHMLHHTQSVPMLDETSALHGDMPQRNDEEGGKQPRLSFSPAESVWGQMGRAWTTGGRNAPRTTESITEKDYVAFFHQFFGLTNNPALAPFANVPCPCQRYFMGGEGAWDHINSCLHHASNWTCAHDHVFRALERICNDAGFATTHKRVLTSEGNRRADLEIRNIRVAQQTDLLVDVTVRRNSKGTGHNGQTQGQLRNPDNPDHILESAATLGFLIPIKRSYFQQSSPGQTEGLKGGFKEWVGGLQKLDNVFLRLGGLIVDNRFGYEKWLITHTQIWI
jgi:hypothetical protein